MKLNPVKTMNAVCVVAGSILIGYGTSVVVGVGVFLVAFSLLPSD